MSKRRLPVEKSKEGPSASALKLSHMDLVEGVLLSMLHLLLTRGNINLSADERAWLTLRAAQIQSIKRKGASLPRILSLVSRSVS